MYKIRECKKSELGKYRAEAKLPPRDRLDDSCHLASRTALREDNEMLIGRQYS